MLQILVIARDFSYINYIERGNFFDKYKQNYTKCTMTNEELDYLFDLLKKEREGYEHSLKPNKYRVFAWSADTRKKFRKELKLVKSIEEKLLHIPATD
jgi:DNA relaxase NicK